MYVPTARAAPAHPRFFAASASYASPALGIAMVTLYGLPSGPETKTRFFFASPCIRARPSLASALGEGAGGSMSAERALCRSYAGG